MEETQHIDQNYALEQFEEYHFEIDGIDVAAYKRGAGVQIILVHGWVGSASHWSLVGYYLSSNYEVHLIDLPGHGKSGSMTGITPSLDLYVKSVHAIIKKPAWLIGHSMGGAIIQRYCELYPENILGMVLVSTGFHFTSFLPMRVAKLMITQTMKMKNFMNDLGNFITKYIYRIKEPYKVHRLNKVIELIKNYDVDTAYQPFLHVISQWNYREKEEYTDLPILILCGDNDLLTPAQRSIEMNKTYRHSFLKIIPKEYHMMIITSAEEIYDEINFFIGAFS